MRDSFRALPLCIHPRDIPTSDTIIPKSGCKVKPFRKKVQKSWVLCFKATPTAFSLPIRDYDRLSYPKNGCSLYASRIFCIAAFGCRDLNSAEPDTRIFAPASVQ